MLDVEADDSQRSKDHRELPVGHLVSLILWTADREPERFRDVPVSDVEAPARRWRVRTYHER